MLLSWIQGLVAHRGRQVIVRNVGAIKHARDHTMIGGFIVVCEFIDDLSVALFFLAGNSPKLLLLPKLNPQSKENEVNGIDK
jgi:hypothetical protein